MQDNLANGRVKPTAPQKIDWLEKLVDLVRRQNEADAVTEVYAGHGYVLLDPPMKKDAGRDNETVPDWLSLDIERAIGCFSGWALPNDWGAMSMHGCCTGNASRTIYWIWDSIVTRDNGVVKVNLLMNRTSQWLDVDSYLPYEGKVVLKIKEAEVVMVRIPEWTDRDKVKCTVGVRDAEYDWSGNWIAARSLKSGDRVEITFPMKTETLFRVIGADTTYTLTIKGYTVVDIAPKGEICPSYRRDHYKLNTAPVKKVTRFAQKRRIIW
jgi:hypothetical protein